MLRSRIQQSKTGGNRRTSCPEVASAGFTMVEVVVALAILGTTIVAVFGAMQTCSMAAYHSRMLTGSVLLAEKLMVEARLSGNTAFETNEGTAEPYRWKVQVAPTPVENLGAIRVQVKWLEQQREQQYELFSLVRMKSITQRR
jgi:prepilin-type N-terminal cleavage/methylation domain-containing protein